MDVSEVLIEENNQTNKHPDRRRDAGYLSKFSFFFSQYTSLYITYFLFHHSIMFYVSNRIESNSTSSHILFISLLAYPAHHHLGSQSSPAIPRKKIISIYIKHILDDDGW